MTDVVDQEREQRIEALRDGLAGWPIGSGYYSTSVAVDDAAEMAAALLDGSVATMLAALEEKAERRGADRVLVAVDAVLDRSTMHDYDGFPMTYVEWVKRVMEPLRTEQGGPIR